MSLSGTISNCFKYFTLIILIIGATSCTPPEDVSNFSKRILISPDKKVSYTTSVELTVTGTGFDSGTRIFFDGKAMATTFVSDSELRCTVQKVDLTLSGNRSLYGSEQQSAISDREVPVMVVTSKGEEAVSVPFTILANYQFDEMVTLVKEDSTKYQDGELILFDNKSLMIFWIEKEDLGKGDYKSRVKMIQSDDFAGTWAASRTLVSRSSQNDDNQYIKVAVSKNNQINLIYYDNISSFQQGNDPNLYYISSKDGGKTWSSPERKLLISSNLLTWWPLKGVISLSSGKMSR